MWGSYCSSSCSSSLQTQHTAADTHQRRLLEFLLELSALHTLWAEEENQDRVELYDVIFKSFILQIMDYKVWVVVFNKLAIADFDSVICCAIVEITLIQSQRK